MKVEEAKFKNWAKTNLSDLEKRGFMPYVRRAYQQNKITSDVEISYFSHPKRKQTEESVIKTMSLLI